MIIGFAFGDLAIVCTYSIEGIYRAGAGSKSGRESRLVPASLSLCMMHMIQGDREARAARHPHHARPSPPLSREVVLAYYTPHKFLPKKPDSAF